MAERVPPRSYGVTDIATQRATRSLEQELTAALNRIATLETTLAALSTRVSDYIASHP